MDGSAKHPSRSVRGDMPAPNTTRLARLEIGSTKLAALAMKAPTNRDGSGSTFAARVAAYTASIDTAAVASFDSNTVTFRERSGSSSGR
jgi:hypothetical protein